jgi:anti-anti-sigma factor
MRLTLLSHTDHVTCLECEGEITYSQLPPDKDPLEEVIGPGLWRRSALLSLEKVTYIDSSGVSWLLHAHREFARSGGRLVLHTLSPMVQQVLQLLKLNKLFTVAADEREALQLAQGAQA